MGKNDGGPSASRRTHTIMTAEEAATGKRSFWSELEITGNSSTINTTQSCNI
jgi:hypothetical protein